MNFETDASVQTAIGLLFVSFSIALIVVGLLILKFKFLNTSRISASGYVGVALVAIGVLLLLVSIIGLIYVSVTLG